MRCYKTNSLHRPCHRINRAVGPNTRSCGRGVAIITRPRAAAAEVTEAVLNEGSNAVEESTTQQQQEVEEVTDSQQEEQQQAQANADEAAAVTREQIAREAARRRNFAIIAHPDAGKTTLTEKLLLFGGAIHEAGEVKARGDRRAATSDWMELEKARGISITSTAMTFAYKGLQLNLLDTPGHQDFSEDTYRTLAAADNAVMLVDGAKGVEAQTRKLFAVARLRDLPIFTVVNKLDRPSLNGFEIVDQLEREFGLASYPITWPVGSGDRFCGLYHRPSRQVYLYKKGLKGRAATRAAFGVDDPELEALLEPDLLEQLKEDVELLEVLGCDLDLEAVRAGKLAPMYFASAANQFGVDLFLDSFADVAAPPGPAKAKGNAAAFAADGAAAAAAAPAAGSGAVEGTLQPDGRHFAGLVFKLQSNLDPKHRDKVAFVRVVSGKFSRGMKAKVARTGRVVALSRPTTMFARDRSTVQEGYAGDVIGLSNPGAFAVGDTVYSGPEVAFPPIPTFSPELFAYLRCAPASRKAFNKGVEALLGEGAVQVLYSADEYVQDPILAAVGQLQFEVVQFRMKDEYGVDTTLEPLPYQLARWVPAGWPAVEAAGRLFNTTAVKDAHGRPVLLFRNAFALSQAEADSGDALGALSPYALPPDR